MINTQREIEVSLSGLLGSDDRRAQVNALLRIKDSNFKFFRMRKTGSMIVSDYISESKLTGIQSGSCKGYAAMKFAQSIIFPPGFPSLVIKKVFI